MPILAMLTEFVLALPGVLKLAVGTRSPTPTLVPIPIRTRKAARQAALEADRRRRDYWT